MRFVFLAVLAIVVLIGMNTSAYAAYAEKSTVEEQISEPLNTEGVDVGDVAEPDVENPEMTGTEPYDTYDESTNIPDVTESDKLGRIE